LDFLSDDLCLWLFDAYLKHSQHDKAMLILGYRTSIMNISSFFFSVGGVIESNDKGFMNFVKIQMQNNLSAIDYPLKHNWINLLTNRINDWIYHYTFSLTLNWILLMSSSQITPTCFKWSKTGIGNELIILGM